MAIEELSFSERRDLFLDAVFAHIDEVELYSLEIDAEFVLELAGKYKLIAIYHEGTRMGPGVKVPYTVGVDLQFGVTTDLMFGSTDYKAVLSGSIFGVEADVDILGGRADLYRKKEFSIGAVEFEVKAGYSFDIFGDRSIVLAFDVQYGQGFKVTHTVGMEFVAEEVYLDNRLPNYASDYLELYGLEYSPELEAEIRGYIASRGGLSNDYSVKNYLDIYIHEQAKIQTEEVKDLILAGIAENRGPYLEEIQGENGEVYYFSYNESSPHFINRVERFSLLDSRGNVLNSSSYSSVQVDSNGEQRYVSLTVQAGDLILYADPNSTIDQQALTNHIVDIKREMLIEAGVNTEGTLYAVDRSQEPGRPNLVLTGIASNTEERNIDEYGAGQVINRVEYHDGRQSLTSVSYGRLTNDERLVAEWYISDRENGLRDSTFRSYVVDQNGDFIHSLEELYTLSNRYTGELINYDRFIRDTSGNMARVDEQGEALDAGVVLIELPTSLEITVNQLQGSDGEDYLVGGDEADFIFGEAGNDVIHGGGGNDTLDAGAGNDNLFGGAGDDIYILEEGENFASDYGAYNFSNDSEETNNDKYFIVGEGSNTIVDATGADTYWVGFLDDNILTLPEGHSGLVQITDNGSDIESTSLNEANDTYHITGSGNISISDFIGADRYFIDDFTGTLTINDNSISTLDFIVVDGVALNGYLIPSLELIDTWYTPQGDISVTQNSGISVHTNAGGIIELNGFNSGDFGFQFGSGDEEPVGPVGTVESIQSGGTDPISDLTYRVVLGDSVSAIMQRMGISFFNEDQRASFLSVNNIENADLIYPGQVFTNPFHADFEGQEPAVVPEDLAEALAEESLEVPLAGGLSGVEIAARSYDFGLGDYRLDVDRDSHAGGNYITTDVAINFGEGRSFRYDEDVYADGARTTDINLTVDGSLFSIDEEHYEGGEQTRDINASINESYLHIEESLYTNGDETRDIDLSIGDSRVYDDHTVHVDGRRTRDFGIISNGVYDADNELIGGDYIRVDEEVYAVTVDGELNPRELETRDVEISIGENSLSIDESVYQNGMDARNLDLHIGDNDHLIVREQVFTNDEMTRDVDFQLGENRIIVDEEMTDDGEVYTDLTITVGDDQLYLDEHITGNDEIVQDVYINLGESSLVIDREINSEDRATTFFRLETGEDYLEIDEQLQANDEVATNYDIRIGAYRFDSDITIDEDDNEEQDLYIEVGSDSIRIDEEVSEEGKTTDTTLVMGEGLLHIDQNYEGEEENEVLTTDYNLEIGQNSLNILQDIDEDGFETEFFRMDVDGDYFELDENREENDLITRDYEVQFDGLRIDIESDINADDQVLDYREIIVDSNRFVLDDNIAADESIRTNYLFAVDDNSIRIENDADINENATRYVAIQFAEDHYISDQNVDSEGRYTRDTSIAIDSVTLSIDESISESSTHAVETDLNYTIEDETTSLSLNVDESINADGVSTTTTRLELDDNYLEIDENIEANNARTSDIILRVDDFRVTYDTEIDAEDNSVTRLRFASGVDVDNPEETDIDVLGITTEIQDYEGESIQTRDFDLEIDGNRLSIEETLVDGDIVTDVNIEMAAGLAAIDRSEDGTEDISVILADDSQLHLDESEDGTNDLTVIHGEGSIVIDESADGTRDQIIRYSDTTITFDETRNEDLTIRTVITVLSGASTIVLDGSGFVSVDLDPEDTRITQDIDGSISLELGSGQGLVDISAFGDISLSLVNGESAISVNQNGELSASIVAGENTLAFDEAGNFALRLVDGVNQFLLDSSESMNLALSDGASSASFNNSGNFNINLVNGNSHIEYDSEAGLDANILVGSNSAHFDAHGNFDINLASGSNNLTFDESGDFELSFVNASNELSFNESGEFNATVSDGSSSVTLNEQGQFNVDLNSGLHSASFSDQGDYELFLSDGSNQLSHDSTGSFNVAFDDGSSSASINNSGEYFVNFNDDTNSIYFDHHGEVSASASIGVADLQFARSGSELNFGLSTDNAELDVQANTDEVDITLSGGENSVGVTIGSESIEYSLVHEENNLQVLRDNNGTQIDINNIDGEAYRAVINNGELNLGIDTGDAEFTFSNDEFNQDFTLARGESEISFVTSDQENTLSISQNNSTSFSVTDDNDGLDYHFSRGDLSLDFTNESELSTLTVTDGVAANGGTSFSANNQGEYSAQYGDYELTIGEENDDPFIALARESANQSITVSNDGDGLDAVLADGNSQLTWQNEAQFNSLTASNGELDLTITQDADGVDASLTNGNITIGLDNLPDDQTEAYLDVDGIRLDADLADITNNFNSAIGQLLSGNGGSLDLLDSDIFTAIGNIMQDLTEGLSADSILNIKSDFLDSLFGAIGEYQRELAEGLAGEIVSQFSGLDGAAGLLIEGVVAAYMQEVFSYFDEEDGYVDFSSLNQDIANIAISLGADATAESILEELGVESDLAREVVGAYIEELVAGTIRGDWDFSTINENTSTNWDELFRQVLGTQLADAISSLPVISELTEDSQALITAEVTRLLIDYSHNVFDQIAGYEVEPVSTSWIQLAGTVITIEAVGSLGLDEESSAILISIGSDFVTEYLESTWDGTEFDYSFDDVKSSTYSYLAQYVGTWAGSDAHDINTAEGEVGSSLGSTIGGAVGSIYGPIGRAIGAYIGYRLGAALGDAIGDIETATANISLEEDGSVSSVLVPQADQPAQRFLLDLPGVELGPIEDLQQDHRWGPVVESLGDTLANRLTAILSVVDAEINVEQPQVGEIRLHLGRLTWLPGNRTAEDLADIWSEREGDLEFNIELFREEISGANQLINIATLDTLQSFALSGGNPYMRRALYYILDKYPTDTDSRDEIPENLVELFQGAFILAQDYSDYREHREQINALISSSPDSGFAIGWGITLSQAEEMGLMRRHYSDYQGGWSGMVDEVEETLVEGDSILSYADIEFRIVNNEREIVFTSGDGQIEILRDFIPESIKTIIDYTGPEVLFEQLEQAYTSALITGTAAGETIESGDLGNDVFAGTGNDTVIGGQNADWIFGEDGNDFLDAVGGDANFVSGGAGSDEIQGGEGNDWLQGDAGNDVLNAEDGDDTLSGGTGNDSLSGGQGNDVYLFSRGDGQDTISESAIVNPVLAAAAAQENTSVLTAGLLNAYGFGGIDVIEFGEGIGLEHINIQLDEITGDLTITLLNNEGEKTNDQIVIESWPEISERVERLRFYDGQEIEIGNYQSFILGSSGDDALVGTNGIDFIHGGLGNDTISALAGDDIAIGGLGNDNVSGDDDDDLVIGGDGNDNLFGGRGDDVVSGDIGDDILRGDSGDDVLVGGRGEDVLIGGSGNDRFVVGRGDGRDTIQEMEAAALTLVYSSDTDTFAQGYAWTHGGGNVGIYSQHSGRISNEFFIRENNSGENSHYEIYRGSDSVDSAGSDTLEFTRGITIDDLRFHREDNDFIFSIGNNNNSNENIEEIDDSIRLSQWFSVTGSSVDYFSFFGLTPLINVADISFWFDDDVGERNDISTNGSAWVNTGAGRDIVRVDEGQNIVVLGAGDDEVYLQSVVEGGYLFGGSGIDTLNLSEDSIGSYVTLSGGFSGYNNLLLPFEWYQLSGFESVRGSDFNDIIIGDMGTNYLAAGAGEDLLVGGQGSDYYYFVSGDEHVTIAEMDAQHGINTADGEDALVFGEGITAQDLMLNREGFDLLVTFSNSNPEDLISIRDWFVNPEHRVEQFIFNSGLQYDISRLNFNSATAGPDWLTASNEFGAEDVNALGGDDIILGGSGNANLYGGNGDDTFYVGQGFGRRIDGGRGNDTVVIVGWEIEGANISILNGGRGPTSSEFFNIENVVATQGDDEITGNQRDNNIEAGAGDDNINSREGSDTIYAGQGNDTVLSGSEDDVVFGGAGDDVVYAGAGDDKLYGETGNDTLYGEEGDDELMGLSGQNTMFGGAGRDTLFGGSDADYLDGGAGEDGIKGGNGDDTIYGGDHNDGLFGESGDDRLFGEGGADFLSGGDGADILAGGAVDDVLEGGAGDDSLDGGSGNDVLDGGTGNDILSGGSGSDYLVGGAGNDTLYGGGGTDYYIFSGDFGSDTVVESVNRTETDELIFSGYSANNLWFEEDGADLLVTVIGTENRVRLEDFSRFRINSEAAENILDEIHQALGLTPYVSAIVTDTEVLEAESVFELVDAMAQYQEPDSVENIPDAVLQVQAHVWRSEELNIEGRADAAPYLSDQSLSVEEGAELIGQFAGSDLDDGDELRYELVRGPEVGTLSVNPNGTYAYQADRDFNGVVSAIVRIVDQTARSSDAEIQFNIIPVNDAPDMSSHIRVDTVEDDTTELNIQFSDPDNAITEYTLNHDSSLGTLEITEDGRILFTSLTHTSGSDDFRITLTHENGDSISSRVIANVADINNRPESPEIIEYTDLEVNQRVVGTISVSDADEGDGHTYELLRAGFGTLINLADGNFEYQTASNFVGVDRFTIRITDTSGNPNSFSDTEVVLRISNVNGSPILVEGPLNDTLLEDESYTASIGISDPDLALGDSLSYSATAHHGEVTFDTAGNFTYTPDENFNGLDRFILRAEDEEGLQVSRLVDMHVQAVNDAPVLLDTPTGEVLQIEVSVGGFWYSSLYFTDIDHHASAYPHTLSANAALGELRFYEGSGSFQYSAFDEMGTDRFTVNIEDVDGTFIEREVEMSVVAPFDFASNLWLHTNGNNQLVGDVRIVSRGLDIDLNPESYIYSLSDTETSFRIDNIGRIYSVSTSFDYDLEPSYDLLVTVTNIENPGWVHTETLTVNFSDRVQNITLTVEGDFLLQENDPVGTEVGRIIVSGIEDNYFLNIHGASGYSIDSEGIIRTTVRIDDRPQVPELDSLYFSISRDGNRIYESDNYSVTVNYIDEAPTDLIGFGEFTISDDVGEDEETVFVGQIEVRDPDEGDNNNPAAFNYSLPEEETRFTIDSEGRIYTQGADFDALENNFHDILVTARDVDNPDLSITETFRVRVLYVNPNDDITVSIVGDLSVEEESEIGTIVGQAVLSEEGNDLSFSLYGEGSSWYSIDIDGYIRTAQVIDADLGGANSGPHRFQVRVLEGGTSLVDASEFFDVVVVPVDEAPIAIVPDRTFRVDDDAGENGEEVFVGQVFISDPDLDDDRNPFAFSYSLENNENRFRIDEQGRIYTVGADFDGRESAFHDIDVTATDINDSNLNITRSLRVLVRTVNPNEGITVSVAPLLSVDEESDVGAYVGQATLSFPGVGIQYEVTGTGNELFSIDANGVISTTQNFDRENGLTASSYQLNVQISELNGAFLDNSGVFLVRINEVDEAPTAITVVDNVELSIDEDAESGDPVGSIIVDDPDFYDHRNATAFNYEIEGGSGLFDIDDSGLIYAASGNIDAENPFYDITVIATDKDDSSLSIRDNFRITVNAVNDRPSDVTFSDVRSIDENRVHPVAQAHATDDEGGVIFSLMTGQEYFSIDPSSGVITPSQTLNYEAFTSELTPVSFDLHVRATEVSQDGFFSEGNVTINLIDVNELPDVAIFSHPLRVLEQQDAGAFVTSVSGSDPDLNDHDGNLTFELITDGGGRFSLEGRDIITTESIDREVDGSEFTITLRVRDDEGRYRDVSRDIEIEDINEQPQILNQYSVGGRLYSGIRVNIGELTAPGTVVAQVDAIDPDGDGDSLNYELLANGDSGFENYFTVDSEGVIRTASTIRPGVELDYSAIGDTRFTVRVTDNQGLLDETGFRATILDEPELPGDTFWSTYSRRSEIANPILNYANSSAGVPIGYVGGSTSSRSEFSDLWDLDYSIVGGSGAGYFEFLEPLGSTNHRIAYSNTPLPRGDDLRTDYTLLVRASLPDDPSTYNTRTLTVSVVNNVDPIVVGIAQGISVPEYSHSGGGTTRFDDLFDVSTLFSDPENDTLSYSVTSVDGNVVEITRDIIYREYQTWYASLPSSQRQNMGSFPQLLNNLGSTPFSHYVNSSLRINQLAFDYEWYSLLINEGEDLLSNGGYINGLEDLTYSSTAYITAYDGRGGSATSTVEVTIGNVNEGSAQANAEASNVLFTLGPDSNFFQQVAPINITLDDIRNVRIHDLLDEWYEDSWAIRNGPTAVQVLSPVVLDLNGDGVSSWGYTRFDADGDGNMDLSRWIGDEGGEGLLALDGNGNGMIDNGTEISFTDDLVGALTDLEGLSAYDSDNNGVLDAADTRFSEFLVWQDVNSNGVSEEGELQSLSALGILSLDLSLNENTEIYEPDGVNIPFVSTFTRTDGTTNLLADVGFSYEDINGSGVKNTINGSEEGDYLVGTFDGDRVNAGEGNDVLIGAEGDDYLRGEDGDDILYGGEGDDQLYGHGGDNQLFGGAGNDRLYSSSGNNELFGGEGDDVIIGSFGDDYVDGGAGTNTYISSAVLGANILMHSSGTYNIHIFQPISEIVFSQDGDDLLLSIDTGDSLRIESALAEGLSTLNVGTIEIGSGDTGVSWSADEVRLELDRILYGNIHGSIAADTLESGLDSASYYGYEGNDIIHGGIASDTILSHGGDDEINANSGNDFIESGLGNDVVNAGSGDDEIIGGLGDDTLNGEDGNDLIYGGEGADTIQGGSGNNEIYGQSGSDILFGGEDEDSIYGGGDNDIIYSGEGNDLLVGGAGNDSLDAGAGHDTIAGGSGADQIFAREGNDTIDAEGGNDFILGGAGMDIISGGLGDDNLNGEAGSDLLYGDEGNDLILGGDGDDYLDGGDGDDVLEGGRGNDVIEGAAGNNVLRFTRGDGNDVVAVNATSSFVLQLIDIGSGDLTWEYSELNDIASLTLNLSQGDTIRFEGVNINSVDPSIFLSAIQYESVTGEIIYEDILESLNNAPISVNDEIDVLVEQTTHIRIADLLLNDTDEDGDTLSLVSIANVVNASAVLNLEAGIIEYTPNEGFIGEASFYYVVSDGKGGVTNGSVVVNVNVGETNNAPTVPNPIADQSTDQNANFNFVVAANTFSDLDGDSLSLTATLANGDDLPAWLVFDENAGTFSGTPLNSDVGLISISVTADDGRDASNSTASTDFNLNVNNVNDAPVAQDDTSSSTEDASIVINVAELLANDSDVDVADELSIHAVSNFVGGVAVLNITAGTITFTPTEDFVGEAQFDYEVRDLADVPAYATVTIDIAAENDSPELLLPIDDQSSNEDEAFTFVIPAGTFVDPDGDDINYSATLANGDDLPAWLEFDENAGTFSGTPLNSDVGLISISVTADDGRDASNSTASTDFNLNVNNVNDAPVAQDDTSSSTEDASIVINVAELLANDSDVDVADELSIHAVSNFVGGVAVLNITAGTITFTPTEDFVGEAQFDYEVRDLADAPAYATVTIDIAAENDSPELLLPIDDQSTNEDEVFTFVIPAGTFVDPDGDGLTYSATLSNGSDLPAWLEFNEETQTFNGTPHDDDVGTLEIRVNVDDGQMANNSIESTVFNITITSASGIPDGALVGSNGNDSLLGGNGNDLVYALGGDDFVRTYEGDDTIYGGTGNDILGGGSGNDTFFYDLYDGNDEISAGNSEIKEGQSGDVLVLGAGIRPEDIYVTTNSVNGTLNILTSGESITIKNQFYNYDPSTSEIQSVVFEYDGTVWDSEDLRDQLHIRGDGNDNINGLENREDTIWAGGGNDFIRTYSGDDTINAGSGADNVYADSGNDIIIGGTGDDALRGGSGDDTFIYNLYDGNDNISAGNSEIIEGQAGDVLILGPEIRPEDVDVNRSSWVSASLTFSISGESIILKDQFGHYDASMSQIQSIIFEYDGTVWDSERIQDELFRGGEGNDSINTLENRDDTVFAGGGNDSVRTYSGEDTLIGGDGNDVLRGGSGSDRYIFGDNSGHDQIIENTVEGDVIEFEGNISIQDLWFSVDSSSLTIQVIGQNSEIRIDSEDWFADLDETISPIEVGEYSLGRNQLLGLISAMSAYDAPTGALNEIDSEVRSELEGVISASWSAV